jgi:mannose-6-phosphate isomerase
LLVKLLDAGQRLPVHAHPDVSFAARHLGRAHGKAEAWFILDGGEVYLGLEQDVILDELKSLVMSQDVAGAGGPLDLAGVARLRMDGERDGHLGLGFDLALQAVECRGRSAEEIRQLVRPAGFGPSVMPQAADQYFRLERVALDGEATLEPGFAVVVVLSGEADLAGGRALRLRAGNTAVAPNSFGPLALSGRAEVLACRPPLPP